MIKKNLLILIAIFHLALISSIVSSADLTISKVDRGSVIISEINNPAIFNFIIDNAGDTEEYEIYSLVGVSMGPKGYFTIPKGRSNLTVYVYPNEEIRSRTGFFNFEFQMKGIKSGVYKNNLRIKIVNLADVFEISASPFGPEDKKINITIRNKENTNIEDLTLHFSSIFFSDKKTISLKPYEKISFEIPLNNAPSGTSAGIYLMKTEIQLLNKKTTIESNIQYTEKQKIAVEESNKGWLITTKVIKKTNIGNTPAKASIEIKKDVISRLFTINSPEALSSRKGISVVYYWEKELAPGESLEVKTQTNYIFPFALLLIIILAGVLAKIYSQNAIILNKRVSLVKTKGGEFALKVTLHTKAKRFVTNVQIIDTLPGMAKIYEKFGKQPDKIDNNGRRLVWNVGQLNAGEERVYTYILYSKLKVVGRFELPAAISVFEKDGKIQEVWSNRTFFVAETSTK